jgi:tetratricopeptide (TPR) repeat protein
MAIARSTATWRTMTPLSNGLTAEQALTTAEALHAQGRLREAEQIYRAVLVLNPDHLRSLQRLGAICLQREAPQEALSPLAHALTLDPNSADTHNDFGIALAKLGQFAPARAEYEKAVTLEPDFAAAHSNLANALAALGEKDEAIARFRIALALAPDRSDTHNDLGVTLATSDRQKEAIPHFERAVALAPEFGDAHENLANALSAVDRHDHAIAHFRKVLALHPDMVAAYCGLGYALQMSEQPEDALAAYARALAIAPDNAEAHRGRGLVKQILGQTSEARAEFETAVRLAPNHPAVHRALAEAKTFVPDDPQISVLEQMARNVSALSEIQQIELHFALAKVCRDLGRHDRALDHLIEGNRLKRAHTEYNEDATLTMLRHIESVFTTDLFARHPRSGDPSEVPIFILGMPRSGSTLIEQILASHPQVFGAGELHFLANAARSFRGPAVQDYFPEVAARMSEAQWRAFGARYIEQIQTRAPQASRITDKMPANFRFIGLIRLALPNARIIHTVRDPIDTCLSCFSKLFAGSQGFAYDLGELGRYYGAYERLMTHWRTVLPAGSMLEVRYETLVEDFEHEARRIIAYCGLDWDDRCLTFYQTERPVRTASVTQVRQPLYKSAIGRWKPYEAMLKPLIDALDNVNG